MSAVTYATAQLLRVLPRQRIGQAIGRLADSPWSPHVGRAVVSLYSRVYDVALDECVGGPETRGWSSFDAFFTRRLRQGVRAIDADPRAVVSPADVARALGMPPTSQLIVRAIDGGRRFGEQRLMRAHQRACELDAKFKNGLIREREQAISGLLLDLMAPPESLRPAGAARSG